MNQLDYSLIRHFLECIFPDRLHLGTVPTDARRVPAKVGKPLIVELLSHPKGNQQAVPVFTVTSAEPEIDAAVLGFVPVVWWLSIMIKMKSVPIIRLTHRGPHDAAHVEQSAEHTDRHSQSFALTHPVEQPSSDGLRGENAGIHASDIGSQPHRRFTNAAE